MKMIKILTSALLVMSALSFAKAESFALRNLDGDLIRSDEYIGKGPVLLDFWATWCKPCMKNLPKLEKIYQDYAERGLTVLAINEDGTRSLGKVEPLVHSLGLTFPVLIDEDREVMRLYRVNGLPTTILLDTNGEVVLTLRGYRPGDEKDLKNKLNELLDIEDQ